MRLLGRIRYWLLKYSLRKVMSQLEQDMMLYGCCAMVVKGTKIKDWMSQNRCYMNKKTKQVKRAVGRLLTKPPKVIMDKKTYTRKKKHKTSEPC